MRVWLALGFGAVALTVAVVAHPGWPLGAGLETLPDASSTATPQNVVVGSQCLVLRDLPYYDVVDAPPDRYIPPRPPMRDPCAVRLLSIPVPTPALP